MLLFNKICSIAQVLKLLRILQEKVRKMNALKSYKHLFNVLYPGRLLYENTN